ncbi:MAG: exopolyphosphatase [Gammaproteobacteria bacterium]|nr:exopolyphosphatase [Gammaproteobacteria bacterium]
MVRSFQILQSDSAAPLAAVDLGSNSFHLIVAYDQDGRLQVVDRHKEMVRLAEGLSPSGTLSTGAATRAIACLERLAQRIRHLPRENIRIVGTNTLRKARDSQDFIERAEEALGHRIEVISGREEARLIYLGVSHSHEDNYDTRLVVDIGGGSTEVILGRQFQPRLLESLHMGCVAMSAEHFPNGRIRNGGMVDAENAARQELEVIEHVYRAHGWDTVIGASGTIMAIQEAVQELSGERGITAKGIASVQRRLLDAGHVDAVDLESLNVERRPVFPGGVAILAATFAALGIERMTVSDGALREGLLHDLLGRVHAEDIRESTVANLASRYHVDTAQADRVARTATRLLEQASTGWQFPQVDAPRILGWGAMLHEIGMDIAHSQYHKHGGYLLEHLDMPGFSRQDQHHLAMIVRAHRRKFPIELLRDTPELMRLCVLMRLAVLFHRSRATLPLPSISLTVRQNSIKLTLPKRWMTKHPLTALDIQQEAEFLGVIPIELHSGLR